MRLLLSLALAGCWTGSSAPPAKTAGEPLEQPQAEMPTCGEVVKLRAPDAGRVAAAMRANHLVPIELRERIIPDLGSLSDVVRTVTIDGTPVRGIIEVTNGRCVRGWVAFGADPAGNIWKLEPPSGVVDYDAHRCDTGQGWVLCDLSGRTTHLYELPPGKQLAGVVNPETGMRMDLPPGR
ncbi:MAG TPA: hypothetical protein VLB44_13245 [Kofleriaceae bacterium]|nr:hypothetical protein [Kofleriaceae bacterium]